jgi:MHS family alpha-ketoglutarate permease-like MFS transporter
MSAGVVQSTIRSRRRSLVAVTIGNALEWYEWAVYSIFAPFIAAAMFRESDPVSALLKTFAVFAIGFFMRPVGGILFGRVADRAGRKTVLVVTLLMMGAGSLTIGLVPDFEAIGVWASVILLAARMVEGLAHGGETATSNSYVSELAPPERRGLWSSISFVALLSGTIFAFVLGVVLIAVLGATAVGEWAWRIPFLFGGVAAVAVLFLRRRMEETDVFSDAKDAPDLPAVPPRQMVRPILTGVGLICGLTVFQYTGCPSSPRTPSFTRAWRPSRRTWQSPPVS